MSKQSNDEMLAINEKQAEFYNISRKSLFTRIWSNIRGKLSKFRDETGIKEDVYDFHRQWLGDLSGKRVLDLGCGRGNRLMNEMIENSRSYLAIDISEEAINMVKDKIASGGYKEARAEVIDFLSPDFTEKFDVIYAYGVLHHFRYFDAFLEKLNHHLENDGQIVSHDPMNTSLPIRILRGLYRPFQDDAEWEWPFTRRSFETIQTYFRISQIQGVLGRSKWAFLVYLIFSKVGAMLGKKAHNHDLKVSNQVNKNLFGCVHVSMKLKKL